MRHGSYLAAGTGRGLHQARRRLGKFSRMDVSCMADGELAAAASGVFSLGGNVAVTRLGYGAMRITGPGIWGEPADRAEAIRGVRPAVGLGVHFIYTADRARPCRN